MANWPLRSGRGHALQVLHGALGRSLLRGIVEGVANGVTLNDLMIQASAWCCLQTITSIVRHDLSGYLAATSWLKVLNHIPTDAYLSLGDLGSPHWMKGNRTDKLVPLHVQVFRKLARHAI